MKHLFMFNTKTWYMHMEGFKINVTLLFDEILNKEVI